MANTIKLKRASGSDPGASDLAVGEIAIRTSNCKLFSKNDGGSAIGIVAGSADTLTTARNIAGVSFDGSANISLNNNAITNGAGYITDLVSDTSPQLGGDLDMNSRSISSGILNIKNTGSQSEVRLYCEVSNAHYVSIKAPAHSTYSGNLTYTLPPTVTNGYFLQTNGSGVLSWAAVDLTALSATNLTSGTIPDARFPSTLPALNGSALTNLNGSNIASGTIAAARVATLNQDTTGNAATATALETARTIAGVSFDGTANISLNNNAITNGAGYLADIVSDTSPQLGGTLDLNGNYIAVGDGGPNTNQEHIRFGNDGDLRIYHTGSHSVINDTGTGNLNIQGSSIVMLNAAGDENLFKAVEDGAVELYYDASKKLETSSSGATITGNLALTGTVDGRDVATDGTKLDGIESGATADQTNSEIAAALSDQRPSMKGADFTDDGTGSPIVHIKGDDGNPWGLIIGNDTYSTGSHGLRIYLDNAGNVDSRVSGNSEYRTWTIKQDDGSTVRSLVTLSNDGSVYLRHQGNLKLGTSSSGVDVTGTCTATTFSGSGASLTSLPAGNLTGTLPAIDGSNLTGISAGATGGGSDEIFYENGQTVTTDYTITNGKNAMSAGPITINSGVTVTVGAGETLTIV